VDVDSYIGRNQGEWRSLEDAVRRSRRGALAGSEITELIRLYLRASSHLAEVQSRYHDPALEEYLNGLVARAHAAIYGTEARSFRSITNALGGRYRAAVRRTLPAIAIVAALLGAVLVATDLWIATSPEAQAGAVPPMAREAIQRVDDGASGLDVPGPVLSTQIFQNNVQVAFLAFALGVFFGVGTIWVIVQNAVFIGLLAGAFQAAGHAPAFWSLVLPHGFLELIAICIAGGSGLRMGWALVDPGDRDRLIALADEARDAVLVVVGVIPAFAVAAAIEGFVTGRTGQPILEVILGAVVAAAYLAILFAPLRRTAVAAPTRAARAP
jgi:uncharacterized membrane protein SpoIIM required for sporulation